MTTLADVLRLIPELEEIAIHDEFGIIRFAGKCRDFRATNSEIELVYFDYAVDRIEVNKSGMIVISLKG